MSKKGQFFSLYKFELFKILKNRVAMVTFIIFFAMSFIQGEFEISGNIEPSDLPKYSEFNGRTLDETMFTEILSVTDDIGDFTVDNNRKYFDARNWLREVFGYKTRFTDIDPAKVYDERTKAIEECFDDEILTEDEKNFWRQKEAEVEKPFTFYSDWIPSGILEGSTNYSIYLIILVSTSLAMIFSMETQRKTDPMIRATINGTQRLYFAKVLAGVTYILGCLFIIIAGFMLYIGTRWGFSGMQAAVQIYWPLACEDMTLWELEGIIIVLLTVFALLLSAFSLLISNITRNGVATMAIVIGGCLGIFALSTSVPLEKRFLNQAIQFLSPSVISSRIVYEFRLVKLGRYFTVSQFVPMLYIALSVILVIAGYVVYARHEIKSN